MSTKCLYGLWREISHGHTWLEEVLYATCDYKMTCACLNYEAPLMMCEKLTKLSVWLRSRRLNAFFWEGISQCYSLFLYTLGCSVTFSCLSFSKLCHVPCSWAKWRAHALLHLVITRNPNLNIKSENSARYKTLEFRVELLCLTLIFLLLYCTKIINQQTITKMH